MMRAAPATLRPTALSFVLLLLLLLLQGVFCSSMSTTYISGSDAPEKTRTAYGVGAPVTVTTMQGATTCDIRWVRLATNLGLCYVLASLLASSLTKATGVRRVATAYGIVALAMVAVAFVVSIGISLAYWGYAFARPPVLPEVGDIATVSAVVPVETRADDAGKRTVVVKEDFSLAESIAYARKDPYYCLDERLLVVLEDCGLLPSAHSASLTDLPPLFPLIEGSGLLTAPDEGYEDADLVRGIVVDARDEAGSRLVFLGLTGMQLSNDHYPCYEMLFTGRKGSPDLAYSCGQRFFYDLAGMEGAEWYAIWPPLSLVAVVVGFVVFTIGMAVRRGIRNAGESGRHLTGSPDVT
jgi:hypothetical protein